MIPTRGLRLFVVVASLVAGCSRQPSNFIAHPTPQMDAGFTVKKADVVRKADGHPRCLVGLLEGRYWVVAPTCQKEPRLRHGCLIDAQSGEQFTFAFTSTDDYIPFNGADGAVDLRRMVRSGPTTCLALT
jgi:hypothetical protein